MRNPDRETTFHFKQFDVTNGLSAMKVGTDGVLLGAWAFCNREGNLGRLSVLDVGTGTGLIALMLAQRFPSAHICGVEIEHNAAMECSLNFSNSPWDGRLQVCEEDFNLFASRTAPGSYDSIVSNPPFFTTGAHSPDENRLAARHEAGLNIETLMRGCSQLLSDRGELAIILPYEEKARAEFHAGLNGLILSRACEVSTVPSKPPRRIMMQFRKSSGSEVIETAHIMKLCIRDAAGNPTPEYVDLVEPFYTKIH